ATGDRATAREARPGWARYGANAVPRTIAIQFAPQGRLTIPSPDTLLGQRSDPASPAETKLSPGPTDQGDLVMTNTTLNDVRCKGPVGRFTCGIAPARGSGPPRRRTRWPHDRSSAGDRGSRGPPVRLVDRPVPGPGGNSPGTSAGLRGDAPGSCALAGGGGTRHRRGCPGRARG